MSRHVIALATALVMAVAGSGAVRAYETGIANIHQWVKIGRKTCFLDHYHYGSGNGPTQAHAKARAINSWTWPTELEYGSSWASFRLAATKSMKCARNGAGWTCDVQARPCRAY
jgi:hypothetical protein